MAKLRLLTSVAVMVAMLMAALPATAFAHDDEDVDCTLFPFAQDLGTDVVEDDEVTNSGASFSLWVTCESGGLDGLLVTSHGSEVTFDPVTGEFSGEIEGTFTLFDFAENVIGTGELEADVEGVMVVDGIGPVLDANGNVMTLSEAVNGDWELEDSALEAEGEFGLDLDFLDFDPFGGFLVGEIESEDEEEEEEEDKKDD